MAVTDALIAKAEAIRQSQSDAQNRIAGRADLTAEAKLALAARSYLAAKAEMDTLQSDATGNQAARRSTLTGQLFGIIGIPGDPVNAAVSLRDAQDRAAQIDTPEDAEAALTRALDSGDEIMARAIAQAVYGHYSEPFGARWADVLHQYADARPDTVDGLNELLDLSQANTNIAQLWAFVLPLTPGLPPDEWQLRELSDDPRFVRLSA